MVVLYGGKIRAQGTADELLADTERTIIQTPRLQPETISRIDSVIQACEGKAIERVQQPRQKLEQLFMDIVEKARQEQVATSGAQHGGQTASFLRGDAAESAGGERLIDSLLREDEERPKRTSRVSPKHAASEPAADEVLKDLLGEKSAESAPRARESKPAPKALRDVDSSVIDSLLAEDASQDEGPTNSRP
jgi:hypothetical protein